jgi:hypothetical protein
MAAQGLIQCRQVVESRGKERVLLSKILRFFQGCLGLPDRLLIVAALVSSHTSAHLLYPPRFIGDNERRPEPQGKQEQNKQAGLHEGILLAEASSDCLEDILRLAHWLGATV